MYGKGIPNGIALCAMTIWCVNTQMGDIISFLRPLREWGGGVNVI